MYRDSYGFELSCGSDEARDAYAAGMAAAMSFDRSGIPELEAAVEADPDFAMAQALLARQRMIYGRADEMGGPIAAASNGLERCTARERSALTVMLGALNGQPDVVGVALEHVRTYPGDAMVLMHVVGPFGLLAFSGDRQWQAKNAALMVDVKDHFPADDWWITAIAAFNAGEVGQCAAALRLAERAWQLEQNGHTAHAMAHVQIEAQAFREGATFLDAWLEVNAQSSDLGHHLVWHRALLTLETDGAEGLLDQAEARFANTNGSAPPIDLLADKVSLFWRLVLLNVDVPDTHWQRAIGVASEYFRDAGFAFADVHRALLSPKLEMSQRTAQLEALETGSVAFLPAIADAATAFANSDFAAAAALLEPVLDEMIQVGGSNPQRAIVRLIYEEAVRRANPRVN
ncbi:MAG: hypothetical protein AAF417_14180 [Pseudomonadota bacterium]